MNRAASDMRSSALAAAKRLAGLRDDGISVEIVSASPFRRWLKRPGCRRDPDDGRHSFDGVRKSSLRFPYRHRFNKCLLRYLYSSCGSDTRGFLSDQA